MVGCEAQPAASVERSSANGEEVGRTVARPIAYINSHAVTDRDLLGPLMEAAGGQVLSELVLDRQIEQELQRRGLELTPAMLEQEKARMLATLSADPDEAARLLSEMRARRGLGDRRFDSLLHRNAGLRLLVQDRVEVPPALVFEAYELRYGPRYRVRILMTPTLAEAGRLHAKAKAGEPFGELAARHSTDPSAAQGGLLSPISPADPSYPKALRDALKSMAAGEVSDLIAVDGGFIIMKLEEILPAEPISFMDVRQELEQAVRLDIESRLMQQAARTMLAEAKVVVLDPVLAQSWRRQKQQTLGD